MRLQVSSHLSSILNTKKLPLVLDELERRIRAAELDFDAIAFTGFSGALIAPILALRLGKQMLLIRKSSDNTHSSFRVEGDIAAEKFIIIDDCISSGSTIHRILNDIRDNSDLREAKCVGIFLYHDSYSQGEFRAPNDTMLPVSGFIIREAWNGYKIEDGDK